MSPADHAELLADPANYLRLAELGEVPLWFECETQIRLFLARWFREHLPSRQGVPHNLLVIVSVTMLYPDLWHEAYTRKLLLCSLSNWWPVFERLAEIHGDGQIDQLLARLADAAAVLVRDVAGDFIEECA